MKQRTKSIIYTLRSFDPEKQGYIFALMGSICFGALFDYTKLLSSWAAAIVSIVLLLSLWVAGSLCQAKAKR